MARSSGVRSSIDTGVLLGQDLADQRGGDRTSVGEAGLVVDPLPHLGAGDLGGGGVLHQVVDRDGAEAAQPRLEVAQRDPDVGADA